MSSIVRFERCDCNVFITYEIFGVVRNSLDDDVRLSAGNLAFAERVETSELGIMSLMSSKCKSSSTHQH